MFLGAPLVAFSAYLAVPLLIPVLTNYPLPLGYLGDILRGGLILALASFFTATAAAETGSPYAQLGASLPFLFCLTLGIAALASRGSMFTIRRVPAWRSAMGGVDGDARYTPFAFANPTRHVLGNLLMTRARHVELEREAREEDATVMTSAGPDMPFAE